MLSGLLELSPSVLWKVIKSASGAMVSRAGGMTQSTIITS